MANDVFNIPGRVGEAPLQDALRVADSFQYTPERQREAFQFLNDIENQWYASREAELEVRRKKRPSIFSRVTVDELVKAESELQGTLFTGEKGQRFWLDHRTPRNDNEAHPIGNWYHTRPITLSNGKASEVVLHYQTTPRAVEKLYDGNAYPLSIQELQTFCQAVLEARALSRDKLYPLDGSIDEFEQEIQEELERLRSDYGLAA